MQGQIQYQYDELIVLRQKNPEEYSPDEEEILQYAQYIGIQLPEDSKLLYIAKQGIIAQLPQEWEACQTKNGQIVYRNKKNRQVQQEHPLDQYYREEVIRARANLQIGKQKSVIDKDSDKPHNEQDQEDFNSYAYGINDYYDVEFDLKPISQLPSIEQDKNQLNQSGVSQRLNLNFNTNDKNDKNEQFSSNLFNQPKKKSKLLLSSLYSKQNKQKPQSQSGSSVQNIKASFTSEWNSVNDLDRNIIISGSKILSGSQQDSKNRSGNVHTYVNNGLMKNNNLIPQQHAKLSKTSNNNNSKIDVAFENLSNRILPSSQMQIQMAATDQQNSQEYVVVGYEDVPPSKEFSDKFQVHTTDKDMRNHLQNKHQVNQNYNHNKNYGRTQKSLKQSIKLNNQDKGDYINLDEMINNKKKKADIKKTSQINKGVYFKNQNQNQLKIQEDKNIQYKQVNFERLKLIQTLSNLQNEQQLKLQLLAQLQMNNQMKMQKIKRRLKKKEDAKFMNKKNKN